MIDNFSINHSLKNLADINFDLIFPYLHLGYLTVYLDMISNIFYWIFLFETHWKEEEKKS